MARILVIEDDGAIRANIVEMLQAEGFETVEAEHGRQGVHLATTCAPDAVICDVTMPQMDGHAVLKELRSHPATATTPFIFVTARADRADVREGMNLGADDYLPKPFKRRELLEAVHARLWRHAVKEHEQVERVKQCARLVQGSAARDATTGLPNRLALRNVFAAVASRTRSPEDLVAVLALSVNRFYSILDGEDPCLGEQLVGELAARLRMGVAARGFLLRLQVEMLGAVLGPYQDMASLEAEIEAVLDLAREPLLLGHRQVQLPLNAGLALFPLHSRDAETLMRKATKAMLDAERNGGHRYVMADANPTGVFKSLLDLEANLRTAVHDNRLLLHYQPQVDSFSGAVVGAEALVRWMHPEAGLLLPGAFLLAAEESGLIVPVGHWVLNTALVHAHHRMRSGLPPIRVGVNLSPAQLDMNLVKMIDAQLTLQDLPPDLLDLEVTEGTLVDDLERAAGVLGAIRNLGCHVSVDDFGTGYASLTYLKRLPVDRVKIDRLFITNLVHPGQDATIVQGIIRMAHQLGLKVVAEGVETEAQHVRLRELQCDELQGFLLGKPVPHEHLVTWLGTQPLGYLPASTPSSIDDDTMAELFCRGR